MVSTVVDLREVVGSLRRTCGMAIHLRHKVNRRKHMVVGVLCQSWGCDTCRPYLQRKWTEHLTHLILSVPDVYLSLVPKNRWDTVSKRISRAGGEFATVEQAGEMLTVFTSVVMGERVSKATAITVLEQVIDNAITRHRPVHTSRGWGFTKDMTKMSEWERVSKLSVTVDEAKRVADAFGLRVDRFWGEFKTGFVVELPVEWSVGRQEEFTLVLEGNKYDEMS